MFIYFLIAYVFLFTFLPIGRRSEPGFCVYSHRCANGKIQIAISKPRLDLAVILVTSCYEHITLPVNSEQ